MSMFRLSPEALEALSEPTRWTISGPAPSTSATDEPLAWQTVFDELEPSTGLVESEPETWFWLAICIIAWAMAFLVAYVTAAAFR